MILNCGTKSIMGYLQTFHRYLEKRLSSEVRHDGLASPLLTRLSSICHTFPSQFLEGSGQVMSWRLLPVSDGTNEGVISSERSQDRLLGIYTFVSRSGVNSISLHKPYDPTRRLSTLRNVQMNIIFTGKVDKKNCQDVDDCNRSRRTGVEVHG